MRLWEPLPWLLALAGYFAFPNHLGFGTELLIDDPVRALARSRARLCRDHHARPRRVLRCRRLYGRPARIPRHLERAGRRASCWRERWPPSSGSRPAWCCCAPRGSRCSCSRSAPWRCWRRRRTWRTNIPAASTACRACRSRRCSACSSSIRSIRRLSISTRWSSCSSASCWCARWSIRRSARA